MPFYWFLAGILTTLASLIVLMPWLRKMPRLASVQPFPRSASVGAVAVLVALFGGNLWLGHSDAALQSAAPAANASETSGGSFANAAKIFDKAADGSAGASSSKAAPGAGSMDSAIANLESRLAKGSGSADDWELLAKSFEFLGRPADAAKARARQLPPLPQDTAAAAGGNSPPRESAAPMASSAPTGIAVSGEVVLAPALQAKAAAGETLFIVAKSVDSPGPPVAVFRASVGSWPVKFKLDDSQSMLPGRNLSSAGRVTIEARISQKGQPLPAAGDLQGSSGVINPADHRPLKIVIDHEIT